MRIAFPINHKLGEYGGYEWGIYNTCMAANAIGHSAEVVTITSEAELKEIEAKYDVLHFSNFLYFEELCSVLRKPALVHIHGYCNDLRPHGEIRPALRNVLSASHVVYSGYSLAKVLDIKGEILWNCYDESNFKPAKNAGEGMVSVINLTYDKGIDRLCHSADVIGKYCMGINDNPYGISRCIKVIPSMGHKELSKKLREYKMFIHPSRAESCSIAIIEALASGLPVICSDVGDNQMMIANGGICIKDWDYNTIYKTIEIIEANYESFRNAAIERSKMFTPLRIGMRLADIYIKFFGAI